MFIKKKNWKKPQSNNNKNTVSTNYLSSRFAYAVDKASQIMLKNLLYTPLASSWYAPIVVFV